MGYMRTNCGAGNNGTVSAPAGAEGAAACLLIENLLGCISGGDGAVYLSCPATVVYTPKADFALPSNVAVTMRGTVLTQDTDYTWTQSTGTLYIPDVTGDVSVAITAVLSGADYTQHEYIQSSGTQYIDTGVYASNNTSAEVILAVLNTYPSGWWAVIGACQQDIVRSFLFDIYNSGSTKCNVENGSNRLSDIAYSFTPFTRYKVYINKTRTYINDELKATLSSYTYTTPVTVTLFRQNYSVSTNCDNGRVRLYSCKIWENDTLVRRMLPCVRNSDSAAGMYDEVGGQFYANAGSGAFTYG